MNGPTTFRRACDAVRHRCFVTRMSDPHLRPQRFSILFRPRWHSTSVSHDDTDTFDGDTFDGDTLDRDTDSYDWESARAFDRRHIWHPYTSLTDPLPVYAVSHTRSNRLVLDDGRALIDGMSSWWCAIWGYGHPVLVEALQRQAESMAHVMFGGITHRPAVELCRRLVDLAPPGLTKVFLADSGSVSVEVAIKMAVQYHMGRRSTLHSHSHSSSHSNHSHGSRRGKHKIMAPRCGYHGDTLGAMSVCDPHNGMHHLFANVLPSQIFVDAPTTPYGERLNETDRRSLHEAFARHHDEVAAFIVEPLVQGAGGMRTYSSAYLKEVRSLCDRYDVLMIADEIATGFGRTGIRTNNDNNNNNNDNDNNNDNNNDHEDSSYRYKGRFFASGSPTNDHVPDILCVGKALTGGTMTMAATLCTEEVARGICDDDNGDNGDKGGGGPGVFMHGPTFMGNPLACAVASASLDLLETEDARGRVDAMERVLRGHLLPLRNRKGGVVRDVRVLGAIGVVECHRPVHVANIQRFFVDQHGVWIRPFRNLIYVMPPYVTQHDDDWPRLCTALAESLDHDEHFVPDPPSPHA